MAVTNSKQFMMIKNKAFFGLIIPAGISLMAVRGFKTSNFLSIKRLKAIAELRAVIMQASTNKNDFNENVNPSCRANANPMQANGNAKTVWLNFTRDK